jgi:4-azaleucine resistance transporter AzlC
MLNRNLFSRALKYSVPVFLGYIAIGTAFGLLMADAGYSWGLALLMSVVMYAGAGQYVAVGLFAAGIGLVESVVVQFVLNARHMAYGITMFKKFNSAGRYKPYLIFALTDETFALLSSADNTSLDDEQHEENNSEHILFLFYISALNHLYWIAGTLIGALVGTLLPVNFHGVSFALTALFIVLMIEQIKRVREPLPFIVSGVAAILDVIFLPGRVSLLSALVVSFAAIQVFSGEKKGTNNG